MSTEIKSPEDGQGIVTAKRSAREERLFRKQSLATALTCCCEVIVSSKAEIADPALKWESGELQGLATSLEQLGRLCFSVARSCERPRLTEGGPK